MSSIAVMLRLVALVLTATTIHAQGVPGGATVIVQAGGSLTVQGGGTLNIGASTQAAGGSSASPPVSSPLPPPPSPAFSKLILGDLGASCTEACTAIGQTCTAMDAFHDNYDCAGWTVSGVTCTPWKSKLSPADQTLADQLKAANAGHKWYYQLAATTGDPAEFPPLADPVPAYSGQDWRSGFQQGSGGCSANGCGATRPYYGGLYDGSTYASPGQFGLIMKHISFYRVNGHASSCSCSGTGDNAPPTCTGSDPQRRRVCMCDP